MSDTTTPTPETTPKRSRGFIDQRLEDHITLAESGTHKPLGSAYL